MDPLKGPISSVMVTEVVTLPQESSVLDAVKLMLGRDIGCIVVCQGKYVMGILTESDVLRRVVAKSQDPRKVKMSDAMSFNPISTAADTTIGEAAERMVANNVKRLVVAREGGELVGLVAMTDIIRWLAKQKQLSEAVLRYLQGDVD